MLKRVSINVSVPTKDEIAMIEKKTKQREKTISEMIVKMFRKLPDLEKL
jgi:hypothetical protein